MPTISLLVGETSHMSTISLLQMSTVSDTHDNCVKLIPESFNLSRKRC
jgi:hypothetical protein